MEAESRLILESGPDNAFVHASNSILGLALIGFVFSPVSLILKLSGILVCVLYIPLQRQFIRNMNRGQLVVLSDGRAQWQGCPNQADHILLRRNCWVISPYAVIRVRQGKTTFLISRSLQSPGNFQRISSWLRLRSSRWEYQEL